MTRENSEKLKEQEYEAALQQFTKAFAATLKSEKRIWYDVPDPTEVDPYPLQGAVLFGSFGDHTVTKDTDDIDVGGLIQGSVVGARSIDGVANNFFQNVNSQLSKSKYHIDRTIGAIDTTDPEDMYASLGDYASEGRGIVIVYDPTSNVKQIVEPIVNNLGMQCRWVSL